jgi:hypothetical protein
MPIAVPNQTENDGSFFSLKTAQQAYLTLLENLRFRALWFMKPNISIDITNPYAETILNHIAEQAPRSEWLLIRKLKKWRSLNIK